MKTWKNWPYWLKGGIIGGGITTGYMLAGLSCDYVSGGSFACVPFILLGPLLPFVILADTYGFPPSSWPEYIAYLMPIAGWFIVGALIGLVVAIYNKIKARYQ